MTDTLQQNTLPSWVSEDEFEIDQEQSHMNISISDEYDRRQQVYNQREIDREINWERQYNQTPRYIIATAL